MPPCPRCGEENPAQAHFCSACGVRLAALEGRAETRKRVTIVFADVAGSTALGERLDPESVRRVLARYFEQARDTLESHGGTVEKFIGDAVMAVFGIPTLHEDDALRAVGAAGELRDRLVGLNDELALPPGARLEARIGVNTGEVVAGDPGAGQAFATGDAVNVAARLEQAAAPGEILVGPETYRLVRDGAVLEPVEPLTLKGKSERVPAWRLVEILGDVPAFQRPLQGAFVGRTPELRALEAAFERALAGGSVELVSVLGPPGVGKSRLARELVASLGARSQVVVGRCPAYGEGITYWPLAEIVRQVTGGDPGRVGELVAGIESADLVSAGVAAAVGAERSGVRTEEIFWAVRKLLEVLAGERPLVAVLDDIHWAEQTFLDLLEYVAGFGRGPILLLCLARADLLDARPTWGAPRPNSTLLSLGPLSDSEADELVDGVVGGAGIPERLRRRVVAAAEGNPLFVEQMLALARETGAEEGEVAVPPTIQALLAARIDRLEPNERAVVERASIEGRLFHSGAVSALLPESLRDRLPAHLMALVRKELIRPDRSDYAGEDAFRFAHSLIRDAAYESVPKELRAELHRRFAEWVERKAPDPDAIVGYHLEQAVRYRSELAAPTDAERELAGRASALLAAAGRRALARGDMPAAANLLERAVSLLPTEAPDRPGLLIPLGTALGDKGDLSGAEAILGEAVDRAAAAGDVRLEWRARLQRSFLDRYAHPEAGTDELLRVAERAIRAFDEVGDGAGLSRAWRLVAEVHWTRCQIGRMEAALEHALAYAREAGERQELLLVLDGLARATVAGPTPVPDAVRRCREIREQAAGSLSLEALVAAAQGHLEAMRGRFDEARELYTRARAALEELGQTVALAAVHAWMGEIELRAGDPGLAETLTRSGFEMLEAIGERGILSTVAAYASEPLYALGRDEEAQRFTEISELTAAEDDVTSQVLWRSTRSKLLMRKGEPHEAEATAREAVALAAETDYLNLHADALMSLAEVLSAAERAEEAKAAAAEALRLYEAKGNIVSAAGARSRLEQDFTAAASPGDRAS